jgi:hypothetical protein
MQDRVNHHQKPVERTLPMAPLPEKVPGPVTEGILVPAAGAARWSETVETPVSSKAADYAYRIAALSVGIFLLATVV